MVIREDSTRSDPEPGHSIVIHFQGQEYHVEVRDWAGGLGVACSRVGNWSSTQQEVSPDFGGGRVRHSLRFLQRSSSKSSVYLGQPLADEIRADFFLYSFPVASNLHMVWKLGVIRVVLYVANVRRIRQALFSFALSRLLQAQQESCEKFLKPEQRNPSMRYYISFNIRKSSSPVSSSDQTDHYCYHLIILVTFYTMDNIFISIVPA